jgi:hypothetical protein
MKKSLLILGFGLVGLIGFAQQNNAENTALLHPQKKNSQATFENTSLDLKLINNNILVISDVDMISDFDNNDHELMHDAFKFEGDSFDYREGVYTLNEYVISYEYDAIPEYLKI